MPVIVILFIIWLLSFFYPIEMLAVTNHSSWWTLFTYNLVHTYFLHLAVNCFVFWTYYRVLHKSDLKFLLPACVIIPAISGYLSAKDVPTCGFSAVISVIMGYYLSGINKKLFLKSISLIIFSYVFTGLFAHGVNTLIHVYSFSSSYLASLVYRRILCRLRK